jgi:hypothetical protein
MSYDIVSFAVETRMGTCYPFVLCLILQRKQ